MTPFYEGWVSARQTILELDRRPAHGVFVTETVPSVSYRIGLSLVQLGGRLMGERVVTEREFDLAA